MDQDSAPLPYLDEHVVDLAAPADAAWPVVLAAIDHALTPPVGALYARLVRCEDTATTGPRPLAAGSTVPGFHVARVEAPEVIVLAGRHHFSRYTLTFRLEPLGPDRSRLHAESRAAFPGFAGRWYRRAVIGTGGHRVAMRRMLTGIARRVESSAVVPA